MAIVHIFLTWTPNADGFGMAPGSAVIAHRHDQSVDGDTRHYYNANPLADDQERTGCVLRNGKTEYDMLLHFIRGNRLASTDAEMVALCDQLVKTL